MLQKNINLSNLAPIVLFTYNRPWHTKQTIEALQKNELAKESELFIFSDGGKDEASWVKVNEVREYLKTINGFKKVILTFQDKNIGLADSIISGVTKIVNQYGKIIVLEDDIVTSQYFLKFMNDALNFYEKEEKVWHISGYVPKINFGTNDNYFFNRTMYCWGWATWINNWAHFSRDIYKIDIELISQETIHKLNLDGANNSVYNQFVKNKINEIKTWAVFWYINIFLNKGLCLIPTNSFTQNIGNDGSGTNCGITDNYNTHLVSSYKISFSNIVLEQENYLKKLKTFYTG